MGSGQCYKPNSHIFTVWVEILKRFALSEFGYYSMNGFGDMYIQFIRKPGPCLMQFCTK